MAITTSKIQSGYEDPAHPGQVGPVADASELAGEYVKKIESDGTVTQQMSDNSEQTVALEVGGEDAQAREEIGN